MKLFSLFLAMGLAITAFGQGEKPAAKPLPRAHAHNDYEHGRPLFDALEQGFGSVEADVYPIGGDLLVAHDLKDAKTGRNLETLYLAPLKKQFDENKGAIIPGLRTLILLVDIKTDGALAYQTLEKQIEKYKPMLTVFEGEDIRTNAVTIILSGDRPRELLAKQPKRWAALDGRLADLATNPSRALVPLISDSWAAHFKWQTGAMAPNEAEALRKVVAQSHAQGRMTRFWALPDREESWALMYESGIDFINTDHLAELAAFFKAKVPAR